MALRTALGEVIHRQLYPAEVWFYFEWNKTDHAFSQNASSFINVKGCQRAQEAIELIQKWLPGFLDFLSRTFRCRLAFFSLAKTSI